MSKGLNPDFVEREGLDLLAQMVKHSHQGTYYTQGWYGGAWNLLFEAEEVERGFHAVFQGEVELLMGSEVVRLGQGDLVLMNTTHHLATDLTQRAVSWQELEIAPHPGEASDVGMLCGVYCFQDALDHPVFSNLPPMILLRAGQRDPKVDMLLKLLEAEGREPGAGQETITRHLIDALLVYILRHWLAHSCPLELGWLRALRDPVLARALALIHHHYDQAWTLQSLARSARTSRASLARHFTSQVGQTPMHYLTLRRLDEARRLMARSQMTLDEVAAKVGYGSAYSLSKAFKRHFGQSPRHLMGAVTARALG